MSARDRNVVLVRLGNLMCVLGWHAVVGLWCLVRGRTGFETLERGWGPWAALIMLGGALIVMTELVIRPWSEAPTRRALRGAAWLYIAALVAVWAVLVGRGESGYDVLAARFSQGVGGNVDPETGSGFAGLPWLALPSVGLLLAFCLVVEAELHAVEPHVSGVLRRGVRSSRFLVPILGLMVVGGIVHLSTGTSLGSLLR